MPPYSNAIWLFLCICGLIWELIKAACELIVRLFRR